MIVIYLFFTLLFFTHLLYVSASYIPLHDLCNWRTEFCQHILQNYQI